MGFYETSWTQHRTPAQALRAFEVEGAFPLLASRALHTALQEHVHLDISTNIFSEAFRMDNWLKPLFSCSEAVKTNLKQVAVG